MSAETQSPIATDTAAGQKAAARAAWALGDYHRFAKATIWERGAELVESLRMDRRKYSEWSASPTEYAQLVKQTFGPLTAIFESLAGDPQRMAAAERDLLAFTEQANSGAPGEAAEYRYEYLRVLGRRA